ncbi:hypothetical protein DVK44_07100 [Streptomyces paludis]|uniref:DUF5808 domain-containing protein n=2 Tax=Streptomyces paludis TaxID=2282738 RepID=A0A345HLC7_9ACTN|nr:hypothetical protein DVK44_07100 [Streptomyces paludis]
MPLVTDLLAITLVTVLGWSLPLLTRPELPFGVRVPPGYAADPAVVGERRRHARRVLGLGALAAAVTVVASAAAPDPYGTPAVTLAPALTLALADALLYGLAHRRIRAAKAREGWYAGTRQGITADTRLRTERVRLPWPWLAPAVLVLLATAAVGIARYGGLPPTLPTAHGLAVDASDRVRTTLMTAFAPVLVQAALTLLMPLLTAVLTRARPDLDAARPAGSARRYRAYLARLVRPIAFGTACANLTVLLLALRLWETRPLAGPLPPGPATALTCAPLALAVVAWLVFEFRVGQAGHRLPATPEEAAETSPLVQREDDRHWHLAGFVYANRTDPALFVHQRSGGPTWTMNLGHPATWTLIAALTLLAPLALTATR